MEKAGNLGCLRFAIGMPFTLGGIVIIAGSFLAPDKVRFTSESGSVAPPWIGALFGLCFLVAGLFAVEAVALRRNDIALRRWAALLVFVFGIAITAVAFGDPDPRSMPAGRWAVAVAGAIFFLASCALALTTVPPESIWRRRTENLSGILLLTLFGILATGLALSPGLEGDGSLAILGIELPTSRSLDRFMLGFFALLIDGFAIAGWLHLIRARR
ncbi:MAG TPA: hypothetical protein VMT00_14820 [Thermoanaerobaculia bacterium]|nr:hypothetical protein [Thermoanaerobaculia bacterium]